MGLNFASDKEGEKLQALLNRAGAEPVAETKAAMEARTSAEHDKSLKKMLDRLMKEK